MAPRHASKAKKAPKVMYGRVTKAKDILTEVPVINPTAVKEMSLNLECPVCMEPLVKGNISSTPCGHIFCSACIHRAAKVGSSLDKRRRCPRFLCPTCRKSMTLKHIRPLYL